ncbi:MAG: hypothetical protein AB1942_17125 [Pseudomonadota bacterium]
MAALTLGGCGTTSVVQSAPVEARLNQGDLGRGKAYLNYFLPETVFVATVKRKAAPTGETPEGGAGDAGAAAAAAKGAKSKGANPAAPEKVDCKKLTAAFEVERKGYNSYVNVRALAIPRLVNQRNAVVASLAASSAAPNPGERARLRSETQGLLENAKVALAAAIAADVAGDRKGFEAQKSAAIITASCDIEWVLEVATTVEADRAKAYTLILQDDEWSADVVSAKVGSNGLLMSVSTTADDKTGEALVAGLKSLGQIAGAAGLVNFPAAPAAAAAASTGDAATGKAWRGKSLEDQVKALDEAVTALHGWAPVEMDDPWRAPTQPYRMTLQQLLAASAPKVDERGNVLKSADPEGEAKELDGRFKLRIDCSEGAGAFDRPTVIRAVDRGGGGYTGAFEGVAVAAPRACEIKAWTMPAAKAGQAALVSKDPPQVWRMIALDSSKPMEAYLLRTRLIKRVSTYTLENGRVVEIASDKPSTTAAVWALPGNLVGGLFSGVAAGIRGPKDVYGAQAEYLNAKASVYTAQAALAEAKKPKDDKKDDETEDE